MSDYYVVLDKLLGWGRREELGRYPVEQLAVEAAREKGAGAYRLTTYWGGEIFDSSHIKVTADGKVLIGTQNLFGPSQVRLDSVHEYRQYAIDQAIAVNQFYSREEREAARRRVREYERTHRA